MLSKLTLPALLAVVPTLRFNFACMIALGDTLISEDVFEAMFACDLSKCKGACCVEGESGAPLEEDELEKIVRDSAKELDCKSIKDMGKVMGVASGEMAGRAEGKVISKFVREILNS